MADERDLELTDAWYYAERLAIEFAEHKPDCGTQRGRTTCTCGLHGVITRVIDGSKAHRERMIGTSTDLERRRDPYRNWRSDG